MPLRARVSELTMPHYALSDEFRSEFNFKCIDSIIPASRIGDTLVPSFNGEEDKAEALSWLTLFAQWALQQGLSGDHTLLLASTHIKYALIYYPQLSTWTEFIQDFFNYYDIPECEVARFAQWYWKRAANIQICWFSYRELKTATNNFSDHKLLGNGKVGQIFKGVLEDERHVAVKKFTEVKSQSLEEVLYEVFIHRSLSKSSHLVKLLGFSSYEQDPLLVYEYLPGGNLEQHLQGLHGGRLTWDERLRIAIDIADAVTQLHHNSKFPIYHRDVKSSNILLDGDRQAKLSDFSIAAAVSHEKHRSFCHTKVKGSRGYIDPHYESTGKLTDGTDVYSFGVVLMELVTGLTADNPSRSKTFLPELVIEMLKLGRLEEIVDAHMWERCPCRQCLQTIVESVVQLALQCCSPEPSKRPKISEVTENLRDIQLEQKIKTMEIRDVNHHEGSMERVTMTCSKMGIIRWSRKKGSRGELDSRS